MVIFFFLSDSFEFVNGSEENQNFQCNIYTYHMSPNLLRAVLLVVIIVGVVYYFGADSSVPNQGTLSLSTGNSNPNIGNKSNSNSNSNNSNSNSSNRSNSGNSIAPTGVVEIVKRTVNPQVDDDLNALPVSGPEVGKRVHFSKGCDDAENAFGVKHNKSVLPFPQYSNNYAPLNGQIDGYRGGGSQLNPQEIDRVPSRCDSGLSCYPRDSVTAAELLPRNDPYNMWSQVNPETPGHLADMNYLESGHHFGINTVGSSLRNPNLQLRADPPIAQIEVSPWLQSTISPDTNRRAFEIGSAY